jgi:indolepyruvate decarboxylase
MGAHREPLARYLFRRLRAYGVEHAFGVPGDFALALYRAGERGPLKLIQNTHEPGAGFAADAYARLRGMGVVLVTYSVGGLNLINPIAEAYAEKSPVVVISGAPSARERRLPTLLHHQVKSFETQLNIYKEVTAATAVLDNPLTAAAEIDRVLEVAHSYKRPVYLEVPRDMVGAPVRVEARAPAGRIAFDAQALREALAETTARLRAARRPLLMVDVEAQRFGMRRQSRALAERLGIPVASTMLGKGVFPEGHPLYAGVYVGEGSPDPLRRFVEASDCVLMLGTFMTDVNLGLFTARLSAEHIINATAEGVTIRHHRYPNVDFRAFVAGLHRAARGLRLRGRRPPPARERGGGSRTASGRRVRVRDLIDALNGVLDDRFIVASDVGDCLFASIELRTASFIAPAYYSSMGFGVPATVGAGLADPTRRVIALVGDGAFQMTGMELITAVKYGLAPLVIVMNNGAYGMLELIEGRPAEYYGIGRLAHARFARDLGGLGWEARTPAELGGALAAAIGRPDRMALIEVMLARDDFSRGLSRLASAVRRRR